MMQPQAHMSTDSLYRTLPNKTSGALMRTRHVLRLTKSTDKWVLRLEQSCHLCRSRLHINEEVNRMWNTQSGLYFPKVFSDARLYQRVTTRPVSSASKGLK